MFTWFKKLIGSSAAQPPAARSSGDAARARVGVTRALPVVDPIRHAERMPLTLLDEGRIMLKLKAANPEMTDVELAKQLGRRLDYVHRAMIEARNSYIPS